MTSRETVLETLVYSPFNHLTDDEQRVGTKTVGLLAVPPPV